MAAAKATFVWDDPFLLEDQLTGEERQIRDTARSFAQERLMPVIRDFNRDESFDSGLMREFGGRANYLLQRGDQPTLADEIFAYALTQFLLRQQHWKHGGADRGIHLWPGR